MTDDNNTSKNSTFVQEDIIQKKLEREKIMEKIFTIYVFVHNINICPHKAKSQSCLKRSQYHIRSFNFFADHLLCEEFTNRSFLLYLARLKNIWLYDCLNLKEMYSFIEKVDIAKRNAQEPSWKKSRWCIDLLYMIQSHREYANCVKIHPIIIQHIINFSKFILFLIFHDYFIDERIMTNFMLENV